jgi:hypothetical protein
MASRQMSARKILNLLEKNGMLRGDDKKLTELRAELNGIMKSAERQLSAITFDCRYRMKKSEEETAEDEI